MFNLELIPDSNNIHADESGSTGTALTGISAVTDVDQSRKGENDNYKTDNDWEMQDDDDQEMDEVEEIKRQNEDNHQKSGNTNDGSKKDDKEGNNEDDDQSSVMSGAYKDSNTKIQNSPDDTEKLPLTEVSTNPDGSEEAA